MTDLWPRIAELLDRAKRPARYINNEWGVRYKPEASYRFCMVYPDTYELGQANQAMRILCNVVNEIEGMVAERAYLPAPEFCDLMREEVLPLFSLESSMPLVEFDSLGITLPHELAATNILEILDLTGIPLHADDRGEDDPLVFGGGPCSYNPEPLWSFFDVFSLGEGEESLPELLELHRRAKKEGKSRTEILKSIARLPGHYVPSLYSWKSPEEAQVAKSWITALHEGLPLRFERRVFRGFSESLGWEPCIVPFTEVVHDRLNVEILRGCTRGCRFCQAGMTYRPVRERSAENIVSSVAQGLRVTGYDEVSLTSLSTTDHSQIAEILTRLNEEYAGKGIRISVPSQRLDSFGVEMAGLVAGQKKGGLTFAPEAGTQRLRDVINKNVTEDDFFKALDAAFLSGWRSCKLYFMIGLPTETDEDIKGIASLTERAYDRARNLTAPEQRGSIKISVSCALFIPKSHTPFQWDGQISREEALRRVKLLRSSVRYRAININWHDPSTGLIEAVLSRGGRNCAAWIEKAWEKGARFDAWSEHFMPAAWDEAADELGFDVEAEAQSCYERDYIPPWNHIVSGVDLEFLRKERVLAENGVRTADCSFEDCSGCGVCSAFAMSIETCEPRHV